MSELKAKFAEFAKGKSGTELTTKDATAWFKAAGLFGKKCTSNDLDIQYSAVKKGSFTIEKLDALIEKMSKSYAADHGNMDLDAAKKEMKEKLGKATPVLTGVTKQSKTGGVDRMTDASKYTGAHKERFDKDGKGKGAEGRTDKVDNTGYVGNYKGANTYDAKK